ncbi:unnamed protein product [Phytomonas sp. EM1]|nr:unnamed protein product [Phytomonas sp. EM1]|eukprot:CCW65454.1 unnamed protein product [Phytomonas sp. isolate EM1]
MFRFSMDGLSLNRHEKDRLREGFLAERMRPEWGPRLIVIRPDGPRVAVDAARYPLDLTDCWHRPLDLAAVRDPARVFFLGSDVEAPRRGFFATDAANLIAGALPGLAWVAVKGPLLAGLPEKALAVLGLALAGVGWHLTQGFCGKCGGVTSAQQDGGLSRRCARCRRQIFPQITPAVLVAVLDGRGRVLLSQRHRGSPVLTILSGFILQGETAEAAARREVEEETGVRIDKMHYVGSQTWPFPNLLMLCYYAVVQEYDRDKALVVEADELIKVEWVHKEEVRKALAGSHPSIACPPYWTAGNQMLREWVNGVVNDKGEVMGNPQAKV